jgi:biopolymer transport protein ExbD
MFGRNKRRFDNQVNAGSMADIAFLLLIFFLVTTTILVDEGILVKLPPWDPNPLKTEARGRNVLAIKINGADDLMVEGSAAGIPALRAQVKTFITNPQGLETMASSPKKAVISLQNDRGTSYDAYLSVYNELKAAYRELWEEEAQKQFGRTYELLAEWQRRRVHDAIPMVISEAEPTDHMEQ